MERGNKNLNESNLLEYVLKSMILWVVVWHSLIGVHWRFQRYVSPPSSGSKSKPSKKPARVCDKQSNMEAICSFGMSMDFYQTTWHYNSNHILHSHYCETSNPAWIFVVFCSYNFLPHCHALNLCEKEHCCHKFESTETGEE
jgi:hypothetical protein